MKTYLLKERALSAYNVSEAEIDRLIEQHLVNTVLVVDPQGDEAIAIYDDDLSAYVADRDITPDKFFHLRGNLLTMTEASFKYQIQGSVISGWVRQGLISVKDHGERNKKYIDEADIAYLAELGRAKKMRPGKKPFT